MTTIVSKDCDIDSSSDSIRVFIRVRPLQHANTVGNVNIISVEDKKTISFGYPDKAETNKQFTFDYVAGETTDQTTMFGMAGKAIVDSCLDGYNGTIFAYGQTSSGKTYTMFGPNVEGRTTDIMKDPLRGLVPRALEYLFARIDDMKADEDAKVEIVCKTSFIEIYNDSLFDLLNPQTPNLQIRESADRGIFVSGIVEKDVTNALDAFKTVQIGLNNRRVASTMMNVVSSRSHAVFAVAIESKVVCSGIVNVRSSQLRLIDLAGSERQGDSLSQGVRLKEAGKINYSLTVLARVINALVEIMQSKKDATYIPYRDSKLTFLLRDSLGGNAKTHIIANIHPGSRCHADTQSTLMFARRAKLIRNKARVNEDSSGSLDDLRKEIKMLKGRVQELMAQLDNVKTEALKEKNLSSFPGRTDAKNAKLIAILEDKITGITMELEETRQQFSTETERMTRDMQKVSEDKIEVELAFKNYQNKSVENRNSVIGKHINLVRQLSTISKLKMTSDDAEHGNIENLENLEEENSKLCEKIVGLEADAIKCNQAQIYLSEKYNTSLVMLDTEKSKFASEQLNFTKQLLIKDEELRSSKCNEAVMSDELSDLYARHEKLKSETKGLKQLQAKELSSLSTKTSHYELIIQDLEGKLKNLKVSSSDSESKAEGLQHELKSLETKLDTKDTEITELLQSMQLQKKTSAHEKKSRKELTSKLSEVENKLNETIIHKKEQEENAQQLEIKLNSEIIKNSTLEQDLLNSNAIKKELTGAIQKIKTDDIIKTKLNKKLHSYDKISNDLKTTLLCLEEKYESSEKNLNIAKEKYAEESDRYLVTIKSQRDNICEMEKAMAELDSKVLEKCNHIDELTERLSKSQLQLEVNVSESNKREEDLRGIVGEKDNAIVNLSELVDNHTIQLENARSEQKALEEKHLELQLHYNSGKDEFEKTSEQLRKEISRLIDQESSYKIMIKDQADTIKIKQSLEIKTNSERQEEINKKNLEIEKSRDMEKKHIIDLDAASKRENDLLTMNNLLKMKCDTLETSLQDLANTEIELLAAKSDLQIKLKALKKESEGKVEPSKLLETEEKLSSIIGERDNYLDDLEKTRAQLRETVNNVDCYAKIIKELQDQITIRDQTVEKLGLNEKELKLFLKGTENDYKVQLESASQEVTDLQKQLKSQMVKYESSIFGLKQELSGVNYSKQREISEIRNELNLKKSMCSTLSKELADTKASYNVKTLECNKLESTLQGYITRFDDMKKEMEHDKTQSEMLRDKLMGFEKVNTDLADRVNELQRKQSESILGKDNKFDSLINILFRTDQYLPTDTEVKCNTETITESESNVLDKLNSNVSKLISICDSQKIVQEESKNYYNGIIIEKELIIERLNEQINILGERVPVEEAHVSSANRQGNIPIGVNDTANIADKPLQQLVTERNKSIEMLEADKCFFMEKLKDMKVADETKRTIQKAQIARLEETIAKLREKYYENNDELEFQKTQRMTLEQDRLKAQGDIAVMVETMNKLKEDNAKLEGDTDVQRRLKCVVQVNNELKETRRKFQDERIQNAKLEGLLLRYGHELPRRLVL